MNDVLIDDTFNPKFVHFCEVRDSELDPFRRLPGKALVARIDEAIEAWDRSCGATARPADLSIEMLEPVIGAQTLRIDIWVERLDESSCTYGYLCSSENGNLAYARGERTLVKADRAPWSSNFRSRNAALIKNLPALA